VNFAEYLQRLPKVELHCHVEGTLRPATVIDLAAKHDVALPTADVDRIYSYQTIYEFLEIFRLVNSTVIDRDDFARMAYESLEDGARLGTSNTGKCSSTPRCTPPGGGHGDGHRRLIDGCKAAESDFGVRCQLIADVYRQDPPDVAARWWKKSSPTAPRADRIGDGRRGSSRSSREVRRRLPGGRGRRFAPHQSLCRGRSGRQCDHLPRPLGMRAHRSRLSHLGGSCGGGPLRDQGVAFTCCPTSTAVVYGWPDFTTHPSPP